jgi:hypothetical protein
MITSDARKVRRSWMRTAMMDLEMQLGLTAFL